MNKIGHKCFQINAKADETEVLIYGDIGENWFGESVEATEFVKELAEIDAKAINVRINSYGGSVTDGLAIYNALVRHPAMVSVEVDGIAASIASLIAMAGEYRGMASNARIMVHGPWTAVQGNAPMLREMADQLDGWAESMASAYTRTGMSREDALAMLQDGKDHWYSAEDAYAAGFIHNVTDALEIAAMYEHNRFTQPKAAPVAATTEEETPMTEDTVATAPEGQSEDNVVEIAKAATAKAHAAILERNNQLTVIRAATMNELARAEIDKAIADPSATLSGTLQKVEQVLAMDTAPVTAPATIMEDARDKFRAGAGAALKAKMRIPGYTDDRSNEFRGRGLCDIAAQALTMAGVSINGMTKSEVASKVLAVHSTSDFPYLLQDAANKSLQAAYEAFPSTWNAWCATGSVNDFKTVNLIRMGSFNSLETIPEGDEYQAGTIGEEREQLTAATKGRFIQMTRQMLINDDLQGFNRLAALLGRAAARTINKDVYTLLTSNPTMSDAVALFDAGHGNLAGTGAAPTVATVGAGRSAMRLQQDPNANDYLNIMPAYVLGPVELEDTLNVLMASEYDPDDTGNTRSPNAVRNAAAVITDPYLSAASTTAWYLVASSLDAPLMEVHFLDGQQTPFVDDSEEFLTDAVQWKVRLDYGVAANDYRGGYLNAGA